MSDAHFYRDANSYGNRYADIESRPDNAVTYTERVHNPDRIAKPLAIGYIDTDADGNAKFVALPGTYYVTNVHSDFGAISVEFRAESAHAGYFDGVFALLTDPA